MGRNSGGIRSTPNRSKTVARFASQKQGSDHLAQWEGDIYSVNGIRKEYKDLPKELQDKVIHKQNEITKTLREKLKDTSIILATDGDPIRVHFTKKGIAHFVRDNMIVLSGKYLNDHDLLNIKDILAESQFVSRIENMTKDRKDGISMFFKYKASNNKEVYFKVAYEREQGAGKNYYLYSIIDKK